MDEPKTEAIHQTWGRVTVLEKVNDKETMVQLASGEKRVVATAWLKPVDGSAPNPS